MASLAGSSSYSGREAWMRRASNYARQGEWRSSNPCCVAVCVLDRAALRCRKQRVTGASDASTDSAMTSSKNCGRSAVGLSLDREHQVRILY
ncbi:hypothetical protein MRX96_019465 [Rhipicephalus microplus]